MVRKLPVAVSEEDFLSIIKATKQQQHKIAFLLGFGSGLRISEVLALQPNSINLQSKSILILQGKGGKDRIVPLPKGFKEGMIKLLPIKVTTSRALQRAFIRACKKSGIYALKPTVHFHSLRHGFATQLIKNGMPIHHVRTLMGHSNISTTNVYLESNPKEALDKYEELF